MTTGPYSIYLEHRPLRIAFLINQSEDHSWLDKIIAYNRKKWGGRYNPIIFSDGNTISDFWWHFLLNYDPDIIFSTNKLNDQLRDKLEDAIDPLLISTLNRNTINIKYDPISIFPSKINLVTLAKSIYEEDISIIAFEVSDNAPNIIKDFIFRNFGILGKHKELTIDEKRYLDKCPQIIYQISDINSLNNTLMDLGRNYPSRTFLSQLCSIPNSFKNQNNNSFNNKFAVIIGNTSQEIIYNWNRVLCVPEAYRNDITNLWLPSELANEQRIKEGLSNFLKNFARRISNDDKPIFCISFSLAHSEIEDFSNSLSKEIKLPVASKAYLDIEKNESILLKSQKYFSFSNKMEFFTAHSSEENLLISELPLERGIRGDQVWMSDIYIQYRPERFKSNSGHPYWWQLPRKPDLISNLHFFNKSSRINQLGSFSVLQQRITSLNKDINKLSIKLPSDESVFYSLFCFKKNNPSSTFSDIRLSDKGKYLKGIINLFPDLFNTYCIFEENYWRKIFKLMSNQDEKKDSYQLETIQNKLRKAMQNHNFSNSNKDVEWLANYVLNEAKKYKKQEVEFLYNNLKKEGQIETDKYNKINCSNKILFDEDGLKNTISELIDWNVLLVGLKPKCPSCGYRIWYHIDEIGQRNTCKGCGYEYPINVEEKWYYRLNSLVRAGAIDHGIIPIILVLGQLLNEARTSFIYMPSIELLKNNSSYSKKDVYCEIDLVCIHDGSFTIFEIKQSKKLFEESDFKKMTELGKIIKPDKIYFSSMDSKPTNTINNWINDMKKQLISYNIEVMWYQIYKSSLSPNPVR